MSQYESILHDDHVSFVIDTVLEINKELTVSDSCLPSPANGTIFSRKPDEVHKAETCGTD